MRVWVAAALVGVLFCMGCGGSSNPGRSSLARMSNPGHYVPASTKSRVARTFLRQAHVVRSSVRLMIDRDGFQLYIARSIRQGRCFITGREGALGTSACDSPGVPFPTQKDPVMNLSLLAANQGERFPRIVALLGIVADGVTHVAVRFVGGSDLVVDVQADTYVNTDVPQRPARSIIAFTAANTVAAVVPLWVPSLRKTP
jgi:hypothetical protein